MGLSSAQWDQFAGAVEKTVRIVRSESGVATLFHHHCAGYVETPSEVAALMDRTDPDLVGLVLDTGHYLLGGGDPVGAFTRFGPRIRHLHFKDCSPGLASRARLDEWDYFESVREGIFCELGTGFVDFPALVDGIKESVYQGWIVVEQDVLPGMGTPLECALRNRRYLRSLGL